MGILLVIWLVIGLVGGIIIIGIGYHDKSVEKMKWFNLVIGVLTGPILLGLSILMLNKYLENSRI